MSISFTCSLLAYLSKTLHESIKIFVEAFCFDKVSGPGLLPASRVLSIAGSFMAIGLSINGCSHSKIPVSRSKTRLTTPEVWSISPRVCSFRRIQNGILILDLPDFVGQRNVKSEIGFVTFVTFRKCVQFAWQRLKKWRVFYSLTNYAIISCKILWSAVRIATMEHI